MFISSNIFPEISVVLLYLDPGTGSLLIQFLAGILLTIPFWLKRSLTKIAGLLNRSKKSHDAEQDATFNKNQ